jgi:hypothetical protein
MQSLVRGHGSIVGEGCDAGYIIKKISEHPKPTRFAVITKTRRLAIPMTAKVAYVEMKEQGYGKGWARLVEIPSTALPPSTYAKALYQLFADGNPHTSREIIRTYAFNRRQESKAGILELLSRRAILNETKPQAYIINRYRQHECDEAYLKALEEKPHRG